MDDTLKKLTVCTSTKNYEIIIGDQALTCLNSLSNRLNFDKCVLIVSSRVYKLYKAYIDKTFCDYNFEIMLMEDSEENKNYKYAAEFFDLMLSKGLSRKSLLFAVGGGVTGDFAGYLAALYMRGIPFFQIPTTLLAMVDSSVGGKVAVNISSGKNMVGAFYQPETVVSDISFIKTLPENELKNGLSEVLKHAIIGENELLKILLKNNLNSIKKNDILTQVVYLSAKFKASVVEKDEKEEGLRAILNYGHTVGHAIESFMEYKISHGEAVAIGMKIESGIARLLGWLTADESEMINTLLKKYDLIYGNYTFTVDELLQHMKYDKKNIGGKMNFVLLNGIGKPLFGQKVDVDLLREAFISL